MHVILFGTGCDLCREIARNIETVISTLSLNVEFEKTSDLSRMFSFGIQSTPSLVIDGEVVSVSQPLSTDAITKLFVQHNNG